MIGKEKENNTANNGQLFLVFERITSKVGIAQKSSYPVCELSLFFIVKQILEFS